MPEVFRGGGEEGYGAGAVFGGDVLFEEFHFDGLDEICIII